MDPSNELQLREYFERLFNAQIGVRRANQESAELERSYNASRKSLQKERGLTFEHATDEVNRSIRDAADRQVLAVRVRDEVEAEIGRFIACNPEFTEMEKSLRAKIRESLKNELPADL